MTTHKTIVEEKGELVTLFDDEEKIIELPTLFAHTMARKPRYSKKSVGEYTKDIMYFCKALQKDKIYKVYSIDEALQIVGSRFVEDWLSQLQRQGLSQYTIRKRDAVLKSFFDWLTTEEAGRVRDIDNHPYSDGKLKTVAPHRPPPKYLTYLEVCDFISNGFKNESERCLVHFLYDTGLRVSEVCRVLKSDLPDLDHYPDSLMYFPLLVMGSKGRGGNLKPRYTIISRSMIERINRLHNNWRVYRKAELNFERQEIPMFLNVRGKPITRHAIQKKFNSTSEALLNAGILNKTISPHRLRHGTAFSILKSEHGREFLENLVVCQRALGHSHIKSTEMYTAIPAPIIAKIQQLGDSNGINNRYEEAIYIYRNTFKPQKNHTEKRGHGSKTKS
ncbi:tyrosine-type recombinase/integrase [Rhodocytophaga aerolata]|uniref:Tyrosine-type recombinase/integrase n=1 Tax=Rhodocytophaga aerolata TaxID=455078 RepID=A0ABT8R6W3_9BACT|nr:tyrosine-type recombinase/integrase [Rhodocytophaga aerolata]MDO1447416.1 tyrosine-type recombinase/integrase [Rhodocytophaga aerolata]